MNERPNRRREERGSRVRDERSQNRPADYGDRPRRSSQKHKGGKVLYYGVLAILLGVLVFSSVKIISYMMEKKESEKNQQDLIDQVVTPVTPSNDNPDGNLYTDGNTTFLLRLLRFRPDGLRRFFRLWGLFFDQMRSLLRFICAFICHEYTS